MTTDCRNTDGDPAEEMLAQAEELIWKLLDDNLTEEDVPHLEQMLRQHGSVRDLYHDCVQLHADLAGHFAKIPKLEIAELIETLDSPVLGALGDALPEIDAGPPVID